MSDPWARRNAWVVAVLDSHELSADGSVHLAVVSHASPTSAVRLSGKFRLIELLLQVSISYDSEL